MKTLLACSFVFIVTTLVDAVACPLKPIRISVGSDKSEGNAISSFPYISGNGNFVTFQTSATNFFANTVASTTNVVLYNRKTKALTLVSKGLDGNPGNLGSTSADISKTGRFVIFTSNASNLVAGDTNGRLDAFIFDRTEDSITRISKSFSGGELNGASYAAGISPNGRYVTWLTYASNVSDSDTDTFGDVYLYDRLSDSSELISVSSDEEKGNDESYVGNSTVSNSGRFVVFSSSASNLVLPRINTSTNRTVYLRDRTEGTTQVVSLDSSNTEAIGDAVKPSISADGRVVGFGSEANITPTDSNSVADAFLRKIRSGKTSLMTRGRSGQQGNQGGSYRHMDEFGNYVSFSSESTNLTKISSNNKEQVYLKKSKGRSVELLSVNKSGVAGNEDSVWPMISSDARWATFFSGATNLVENDSNDNFDVFLVRTSVGRNCK